MVKVAVSGALGRMGRTVLKAVLDDKDLTLVAAVDVQGGADVGELIGQSKTGICVQTDLAQALATAKPEVLVDFTQPQVVFHDAEIALRHHVIPVIGTTGMREDGLTRLRQLCAEEKTPAFVAPNFAIGAVLLMQMCQKAVKYLPNVEIVELHHDNKLDAPSGTAIRTAQMMLEVRGERKQGHPDEKETLKGARGAELGGIRIHSVRLPGYVAHQEVIFGGLGQTLTIRHDSMNRESFMPGVVLACKKAKSLTGLVVGLENLLD